MSSMIFFGSLVDFEPGLALTGQYPTGVIGIFLDPTDLWGFEYHDAMFRLGWPKARVLQSYGRFHGPSVTWVYQVYFDSQMKALQGLREGVEQSLKRASDRGIRLWVLADGTREVVREAMRRYPPISGIQDVMVSAEEGLPVSDPIVLQRARKRFGLDAERTLVVSNQEDLLK